MSKLQTVKEFLRFIGKEKKWWLYPLVIMLFALAALIIFAHSSSLAPFLYPFF